MSDDEIIKLTDKIIEDQLKAWPKDAPFGILRTAIEKDLMVPAMTLIALTVRNRTRELAIEAAKEEQRTYNGMNRDEAPAFKAINGVIANIAHRTGA